MKEEKSEETFAFQRFMLLFIIGFVMIFVGVIILMVAAAVYGGGTASFGGIIFIGPIPIVFGAGPEAMLMVMVAIILAVLSIIMFFIFRRKIESASA
ncbi:MAG: DUF131 domain-containing protein [Candidatus Bathyarchaeia archaeon]